MVRGSRRVNLVAQRRGWTETSSWQSAFELALRLSVLRADCMVSFSIFCEDHHFQSWFFKYMLQCIHQWDILRVCLVVCICACLHHRMRVAVVWLLWARLYACELYVWLPTCRFRSRLARSLKHPGPGSPDTSRLVASPEPGSSDPSSHSQVGERN
jgi:hypothetical protein